MSAVSLVGIAQQDGSGAMVSALLRAKSVRWQTPLA
jgi:hypothetical protein